MNRKITGTRLLLYFGIGCLVILLGFGFLNPSAEYLPQAADSPKSDGTKAMFLLLNQAGFKVSELFAPIPPEPGMMIMVRPDGDCNSQDWNQVIDWVGSGNTLLLASDESNGLYKHFNFELDSASIENVVSDRRVNSTNPLLKDVHELTFSRNTRLKRNNSMSVVYGDEQGAYLAEVAYGKGRILLLTLPNVITNKEIGQKDNLILLLNIVRLYGQKGIWFNEYVHGYTWEKAAREVFAWPLRLVAIQLGLGVLLFYWFWGKRFGRPLPLTDNKSLYIDDYVNSIANIYRQGRARHLVLDSIYQGFKDDLAQCLGVRDGLATSDLVKLCAGRPSVDSQSLKGLFSRCEKLMHQPDLAETALFTVVRDMEIWLENNFNSYRRMNND